MLNKLQEQDTAISQKTAVPSSTSPTGWAWPDGSPAGSGEASIAWDNPRPDELGPFDGPSLEDQLAPAVHNAIGALEAAGFTVTVLDVKDGHAKVEIEMGDTNIEAGGVGISSKEGYIVNSVWLHHTETW